MLMEPKQGSSDVIEGDFRSNHPWFNSHKSEAFKSKGREFNPHWHQIFFQFNVFFIPLNIFLEIQVTGHVCYQFRILRNLGIDIKDRLEEYSQSIELNI